MSPHQAAAPAELSDRRRIDELPLEHPRRLVHDLSAAEPFIKMAEQFAGSMYEVLVRMAGWDGDSHELTTDEVTSFAHMAGSIHGWLNEARQKLYPGSEGDGERPMSAAGETGGDWATPRPGLNVRFEHDENQFTGVILDVSHHGVCIREDETAKRYFVPRNNVELLCGPPLGPDCDASGYNPEGRDDRQYATPRPGVRAGFWDDRDGYRTGTVAAVLPDSIKLREDGTNKEYMLPGGKVELKCGPDPDSEPGQ